ncbi:hypothetical protein PWY87_34100 [Kribbella solani]|uniref:hypothetical protein n=1 Tax=Kribbella solani TaxID=236067 RepID=UPI0029A0AA98|nr:hypothetical protein [Kribbella solani]MDX3006750.1 hypothetical protein [Kribbella solani]
MRVIAMTAAAVVLVAGCSSDNDPAPGPATSVSSSSPTADPYDVYLKKIPKGEPTLSREDAATRAYLGCGKKWPPGTTDAVLAEVYASYCK